MNPTSLERTAEERIRLIGQTLDKLLISDEVWRVTRVLDSVHPADAADLVESLPEDERRRVYEVWDPERAAKAFEEMEESDRLDLAGKLPVEAVAEILSEMSPDDSADLLGVVGVQRRFEVLQSMAPEPASEVHRLLRHRADTAGGMMTPRVVSLEKNMTIAEAIERLREESPDGEESYHIFVVDDKKRLAGVLPLRSLIVAQPNAMVKNVMDEEVFYADIDTDREEVIRKMRKYNLSALPVIDDGKQLAGMVTFDDAFEAFEDEATEDAYRMVGAVESAGGDVMGSRMLVAARARMPWVAIALLGETLVVGAIAEQFQEFLLVKVPVLILFFTAMTNLGGNIATQAATIIVRGFATGQLEMGRTGVRLWREVRLGLLMGVMVATAMGVIAFLIADGSLPIGVVVGLAALSVVIGGALIGTIVPIASHRMGVDPAVTTPILTVLMDAASLLIYLGVALLLLRLPVGG